jgi:hypothetical protein
MKKILYFFAAVLFASEALKTTGGGISIAPVNVGLCVFFSLLFLKKG